MDHRRPIDLPDDYGTQEDREDARFFAWAAVLLGVVVIIVGILLKDVLA